MRKLRHSCLSDLFKSPTLPAAESGRRPGPIALSTLPAPLPPASFSSVRNKAERGCVLRTPLTRSLASFPADPGKGTVSRRVWAMPADCNRPVPSSLGSGLDQMPWASLSTASLGATSTLTQVPFTLHVTSRHSPQMRTLHPFPLARRRIRGLQSQRDLEV